MKNSGYKEEMRDTPEQIHNRLDNGIKAHFGRFNAMADELNVIHGKRLSAWADNQMEAIEVLAYFENKSQ